MTYLKQVLLGIDQLFNTLTGGYADETLSSRVWRLENKGKLSGRIFRPLIDFLFFFQEEHCYNSFLSEVERRQLPREFRE
jgi:hypothetical protein